MYQRLEQQAREYVLEMKVRLLKHLSAGSKTAGPAGTIATAHSPPQAHQFISLLLEEYSALCQAARTISSFLLTLVSLCSQRPVYPSFNLGVGGISKIFDVSQLVPDVPGSAVGTANSSIHRTPCACSS